MATLALGAAGSALGGPVGQAIGAAVGSYIDNAFLLPQWFPVDPIKGPRVGDLQTQTGSEGDPIYRAYGAECRLPGTVIWASPLKERKRTEEVGGKGGAGVEQTTYTYSVDVAVLFCEGPPDGNGIVEFSEVYGNTKTIYEEHPDKTVTSTQLSADADVTYRTDYSGEEPQQEVDYYLLTINSPNGGPDLSVFKSGKDLQISGFAQAVDNGTFRVIRAEKDDVAGTSFVRVRSRSAVFVDDANGGANSITLFQDLPAFNSSQIQSVTKYLGTEVQTADATIQSYEDDVPAFRGLAYIVFKGLQLAAFGNQLPNMNALVWATGTDKYDGADPETVGGMLSKLLTFAKQDEHRFKGLSAITFDTSAVDAIPIRGYVTRGPQPLRDIVQPVLLAYDVTAQESNGTVTFFERKNAATVAVNPDDLAAHAKGSDTSRLFRTVDRHGQDLPKEVVVTYLDPERRYQAGSQSAKRLDAMTSNVVRVDLPVVMTAVEAKDIAERVLWTQWANRRGIVLELMPSAAWTIQENDVVTFTDPDTSKAWRVLVQKLDQGVNGLVRITGVEEIAALLSHSSVADSSTGSDISDGAYIPPELHINLIDIGALRDSEAEVAGIYYSIDALDPNDQWPGGTLFQSTDGGTSYLAIADVQDEAAQGRATTALGSVPCAWLWDRKNTVRVDVGNSSLSSRTEDEVLAGANRMLVGGEVIGFATATLVTTGVYDLTDLLRGLIGTEDAIGVHTANEEAVLLTAPGINFLPIALASLGVQRHYKPVPSQGIEADFDDTPFTPIGRTVYPPSVVHFYGERQSNDDWTLTWSRRTRAAIDPIESDDIPLLEDSESYEIEVRNVSTGAVINTYTSSTPSYTYTSAQQTTDFGSAQSSIRVAIYQISARVGRGKPEEKTF